MRRERRLQLEVRRHQLVTRSRALRLRLAYDAQPLQRPLALADRVLEGVQWLKARPLLLAAIVAFPVLLRPRRAMTWALKLSWAWGTWRKVQRLVMAASARS